MTIESDYKPLESIFKKELHAAPARLKRIMFDVIHYNPKVIHVSGTQIPLADLLSRDCDTSNLAYNQEELKVMITLPISHDAKEELDIATRADPELQELIKTIISGFPEKAYDLPAAIRHYFNFKEEIVYSIV